MWEIVKYLRYIILQKCGLPETLALISAIRSEGSLSIFDVPDYSKKNIILYFLYAERAQLKEPSLM